MTLIKSISGIRGTIGGNCGEALTPIDIVKFTSAYAKFISNQDLDSNTIILGRDARISGPMLRDLVTGTLIGCGLNVLDLGLSTTPTVEVAVQLKKAAGGIILTRLAFDSQKALTSMEGNFYRCLGALFAFFLFSRWRPLDLYKNFSILSSKLKGLALIGSLIGTFLSLALYLKALQTGHLATLSGLAITGTIFAAFFECLLERRWPSKYLLISFCFFLFGMNILLFQN